MADKFLIRAYNVELGDCIYCRIPKARKRGAKTEDFHMLIDCGSLGPRTSLTAAVADLETLLPQTDDGQRRLDLLVVTHEHKDHIAGFVADAFANIVVETIWMSAAMDPKHPQAEKTRRLHALAADAMQGIAARNLSLSPELEQIVGLFSLENAENLTTLRKTLPAKSGRDPIYVHAGQSSVDLGLALKGATIHVLAPQENIDFFYLGRDDAVGAFLGLANGAVGLREPSKLPQPRPSNISDRDFRTLQSRMLSAAFAFADESGRITNNTSVVLLIEWKGKRLLFVGDAEWDNGFKAGKSNGSWNVMWHEQNEKLAKPVDFLKIGHHGSINSTPWGGEGDDQEHSEPAAILNSILPLPAEDAKLTAQAVVSTLRKNFKTIPDSLLLTEIGRRVKNTRIYSKEFAKKGLQNSDLKLFRDYEETWFEEPQPLRTDCELLLSGDAYVDIVLTSG